MRECGRPCSQNMLWIGIILVLAVVGGAAYWIYAQKKGQAGEEAESGSMMETGAGAGAAPSIDETSLPEPELKPEAPEPETPETPETPKAPEEPNLNQEAAGESGMAAPEEPEKEE